MSTAQLPTSAPAGPQLPWAPLVILSSTTFVAIVSELMPAGLLTPMAADLGVRESGVGLLVTVYALATGLTAIPIIAVTRGVSRHLLLSVVVLGFAAVNLLTAVVTDYALMLVIRVFGGIFTGVIWSMVGSYASALVPAELRGRAIAIAVGGASVGFSVGNPAAAALGALVGWRAAFAVMAAIGLVAFACVVWLLPRVEGQAAEHHEPFLDVLRRPGVLSISAVTTLVIIGHQAFYTYLDPFVQRAGLQDGVSAALLLFGIGALIGMAASGPFIDRDLRRTLLVALAGIAAMLGIFGLLGVSPVVAVGACLLWGLAYGTLTPIMQTAAVRAGGDAADLAVSFMVTAWSVGIALGAALGGIAFDARGAGVLPWVGVAFTLAGLAGVLVARRGFPRPAAA